MAESGIATQAWSPIGGVYAYGPKQTTALENPVIVEIAAKHGKTPAQLVLRWHIEHGFCAIPKSVKPHRIAENIDIFDFQLSSYEVAAIDALDTGVRGGPEPASISPATYPYKVEDDRCRTTRSIARRCFVAPPWVQPSPGRRARRLRSRLHHLGPAGGERARRRRSEAQAVDRVLLPCRRELLQREEGHQGREHEVLATMIRKHVVADVYRIRAAAPYPHDYEATVWPSVREQHADARPPIANPLKSIDAYDVILLGSPNLERPAADDHVDVRGELRLQRQDDAPIRHLRR
jgi:hypothetical protein